MKQFIKAHKNWFVLLAIVIVVDVTLILWGFGGIKNIIVTSAICIAVIIAAIIEKRPLWKTVIAIIAVIATSLGPSLLIKQSNEEVQGTGIAQQNETRSSIVNNGAESIQNNINVNSGDNSPIGLINITIDGSGQNSSQEEKAPESATQTEAPMPIETSTPVFISELSDDVIGKILSLDEYENDETNMRTPDYRIPVYSGPGKDYYKRNNASSNSKRNARIYGRDNEWIFIRQQYTLNDEATFIYGWVDDAAFDPDKLRGIEEITFSNLSAITKRVAIAKEGEGNNAYVVCSLKQGTAVTILAKITNKSSGEINLYCEFSRPDGQLARGFIPRCSFDD